MRPPRANHYRDAWCGELRAGDEGTSLKDMQTGEQKTVEPDTVMHHIRGGL